MKHAIRIAALMGAAMLMGALWSVADAGAQEQPMTITAEVWSWYQEYVGVIGASHPGAFAVSRDGRSAFSVYCQEIRCAGGPTYKQEAIRRCESAAGQDCLIFAFGGEILVAYEVIEEPESPAPPSTPVAAVPPAPPEPQFESPLPDGTIVLSSKVAAQLQEYLSQGGVRSGRMSYFYVATDGRAGGSYICPVGDCHQALGVAYGLVADAAKKKARGACETVAEAGCVMLYAIDGQKRAYKIYGQ